MTPVLQLLLTTYFISMLSMTSDPRTPNWIRDCFKYYTIIIAGLVTAYALTELKWNEKNIIVINLLSAYRV